MVYTSKKAVVESAENIDMLKDVASNGSIYEFCDTYAEKALALCAFAEGAYTELFESIGCNELAFYESTGKELDYVSEAEEDKKVGVDVKAFFQKIWGAIKAAYEKVIAWIDENVKGFVNTLKNNGIKDLKVNWGSLKSSIDEAKEFGTLNFTLKTDELVNEAKSWKSPAIAFAANGSKIDEIYGEVFKMNDVKSVSELQKALKAKFTLEKPLKVNKKVLDENFDTFVGIVEKGKLKDAIKAQYTAEKDVINNLIKSAEKIKNKSDELKNRISVAKGTINVTNAAFMVLLDIDKKVYVSCRNILISVLRTLSKNENFKGAENKEKFQASRLELGKKKEEKKEEATGESATAEAEEKDAVTESINALFAW